MKKIKVLIVDDSALIRQMMQEMLSKDPLIEVVGVAQDPYVARDKIKQLNPDVLTLDVEMPRMDGLTFLRNLMRLRPLPVVMVSSLTEKGAEVTLQALELGAIDFVTKPKVDVASGLQEYQEDIISKVKMAAASADRVVSYQAKAALDVAPKYSADAVLDKAPARHYKTTDKIIAIGASTGGTEAIKDVLTQLPPDMPGIVITQHIPEAFSRPFANRLNNICALNVSEAEDGQQVLPGHAYVAPGSAHLMVVRDGAKYRCKLNDGPPVNRHRPSVDVLFRSLAQNAGPNALGVILTGMGDDGARGMLEMHEAGASTVAQDENTSVVWGMPGEAVKLGGVDYVMPLGDVSGRLLSWARSGG